MGKTYATRVIADLPGITLVHDASKADPQYGSAITVATVADLHRYTLEELSRAQSVSFRGDVFKAIVCEVEEVAALALQLARSRTPVRLVVDELDLATTPGGKELASESLRLCLTQGRCMRLDVLATTQAPVRAPREVIDQATSIGLFRVGPRALTYLDDRLYFDAEMLAAVPTLERGEFVLHRPSVPWNRTVYRF
jgi:hypothetical protein